MVIDIGYHNDKANWRVFLWQILERSVRKYAYMNSGKVKRNETEKGELLFMYFCERFTANVEKCDGASLFLKCHACKTG